MTFMGQNISVGFRRLCFSQPECREFCEKLAADIPVGTRRPGDLGWLMLWLPPAELRLVHQWWVDGVLGFTDRLRDGDDDATFYVHGL